MMKTAKKLTTPAALYLAAADIRILATQALYVGQYIAYGAYTREANDLARKAQALEKAAAKGLVPLKYL